MSQDSRAPLKKKRDSRAMYAYSLDGQWWVDNHNGGAWRSSEDDTGDRYWSVEGLL
jgi:hypothetical protein